MKKAKNKKALEPVAFSVDKIYNCKEAARILRRTEQTIRRLCELQRLKHTKDGAGFLIGGWAIRDYCEMRSENKTKEVKK